MRPRADASPDDGGVVVAAVRPGTPAGRAGLRAGDRLTAINGSPLRDTIDFHFHAGDQRLVIGYVRAGRTGRARLIRLGPELGLTLEPPRPADIATCANKCVFCFIHQLPRGMRRSLYVKDDDFRLSFLHGNYITLTDLEEAELERIETQRLSPLYVSVHATDPEVRHRLLGEPRVRRDVLPVMARLARAGIVMHAQIVLVPGWNDGAVLERSVRELAALHPGVVTTAVVPVGLTRHRERLPSLRTVSDAEARDLVTTIEGWQRAFRRTLGTRFVWPADELYLQAGRPVPAAGTYEGFAVAEDGIGLVRRFADGVRRARARLPAALPRPRAVTVVTGEMFAPSLLQLVDGLPVQGLRCRVAGVANEWFGRGIGVAGLLTAQDIERQLAGTDLGDEVLVPAAAIRDGDSVFLDDHTPADLARALATPVRIVAVDGSAFLGAILGRGGPRC